MNLDVIKKIAKLGKEGYEPEDRESYRVFTMVYRGPAQSTRNAAHSHQESPNVVLLRDDGETFIPEWIHKELEDDLRAVAGALNLDTSGTEPHELIPYIVEKIGFIQERMSKLNSVISKERTIEEIELDLD